MKRRGLLGCLAAVGLLMGLGAPATWAKTRHTRALAKAQVRQAIASYDAQLATAAAHVETAIDEWSASKGAAALEAASSEDLTLLRDARTTVKAVKVGAHPLIREGKIDITEGLHTAMVACERLARAFTASVSPKRAQADFRHFRSANKRADAEIHRGERIIDR